MKKGFSLAEVLITLGIVGVIAAISIPVLNNYQKSTTVAKLKEVYSILLQAAKLTENEIGSFNTQLSSEEFIKTYFAPHMKIISECKGEQECYGSATPLSINRAVPASIPSYMVTMTNGAYFGTLNVAGGSTFYIDLNGASPPNLAGRDIFYFYLVNTSTLGEHKGCENSLEKLKSFESGLYPGSLDSCYIPHASLSRDLLLSTKTHRACNKNATNTRVHGDACAALIMKDNWKISPDYPW